MKKNLLGAAAALLLLNALSCATKDTWAGVYTGVIPSAGGMGIDVRITLNANETYKLEYGYIGKSDEAYTSAGKFTWNPERTIVIFDTEGQGDPPKYYKLGQRSLIHLDIEGNIITGELANDYILTKQ